MLKINTDYTAPTTQLKIEETLKELEKKQSEMAYKADMQQRKQLKDECSAEFEKFKIELPG